ncbi:PilZ domain-containing protein [Candidatus Colwellia aromaticivorans]|uniref:PilZ domain-containing protein n=1 Tax=Candidatus Colwellia aromaticivorans TaxID=2267621 RepID=UPI000DF4357A|nr:PilZ domain-containing protein [Candidatus Colwellia aromaticivorans]
MVNKATNVETATRLNRNLSLLHAGSMISIEIITPAGQRAKFRTTFIGYLPKRYVLIQFPDMKKLGSFAQHITQGMGITVRGLIEGHEGAVLAFISTIKQTIQMPSRIIVLDFPRTVGIQNLRSAIRIDTHIHAKVKIDQDYWQTTIINLSVSGCQLNIENGEKLVLSEKKVIEIIIEDKQGGSNIKLSGTVCNLKQQADGLSFGVKFNKESDNQVNQLLLNTITIQE